MFVRTLTATALAASVLAVVPMLGTYGQAHAESVGQSSREGRTCLGKPVTIVGKPGGTVRGTGGSDVIRTNGAAVVLPRAGNDRVCVTGSRGRTVMLGDTAGNDQVVVQSRGYREVQANLGPGKDVFRGGAGRDIVHGSGPGDGSDRTFDDISTGAGRDSVVAGGNGTELADQISLGAGDDGLRLSGTRMTDTASLAGGTGTDRVEFDSAFTTDITFDVPSGTATSVGRTVFRFGGFNDYVLTLGNSAALTFLGTDAPERLQAFFGEVDAEMGGGDDNVNFSGSAGSDLRGGPGSDTMVVNGFDTLSIDATTGEVVSYTTGTSAFASFDTLHGVAQTVSIMGSDIAETLRAYGCQVVVRAGGGADTLDALGGGFTKSDLGCDTAPLTSEMYGEDGDDTLIGRFYDDTLIGGAGTDVADGEAGTDNCDAESTVRCEN